MTPSARARVKIVPKPEVIEPVSSRPRFSAVAMPIYPRSPRDEEESKERSTPDEPG